MQEIKIKLQNFITDTLPKILDKYGEEEYDEILDERDEEHFSNVWMETFNSVKSLLKENNLENSFSNSLRESAFKIVLTKTNSSDMAAYISDDFGLIYDSILTKHRSNWLNSLWLEYKNNKVPSGKIEEFRGDLAQLL